MNSYRQRVFTPWFVVSEIPIVLLAVFFDEPWYLLLVVGGLVGSWIGTRSSGLARDLNVSEEGIRVWGVTIPWADIDRLDLRHPLLGGYRLPLREPISYPRWLSPWKTKAIWLSAYERPIEIGADIARWAPHLLEGRDRANA